MKYAKECKEIWKKFVPKNGQADTIQGELLRQVEKLRWEAQNNGNMNWDNNFDFFCDFLHETLVHGDVLGGKETEKVSRAILTIKDSGSVACKYYNGEISDEVLEKEYNCNLAHIEDDIYDLICDAVGAYYVKNKEPIPYSKRPDIYR